MQPLLFLAFRRQQAHAHHKKFIVCFHCVSPQKLNFHSRQKKKPSENFRELPCLSILPWFLPAVFLHQGFGPPLQILQLPFLHMLFIQNHRLRLIYIEKQEFSGFPCRGDFAPFIGLVLGRPLVERCV